MTRREKKTELRDDGHQKVNYSVVRHIEFA